MGRGTSSGLTIPKYQVAYLECVNYATGNFGDITAIDESGIYLAVVAKKCDHFYIIRFAEAQRLCSLGD